VQHTQIILPKKTKEIKQKTKAPKNRNTRQKKPKQLEQVEKT
jgi:hypothetical protein